MYETFIKPLFRDVKKFTLDTLFPVRCLICEKDGEFICLACRAKLVKLSQQHCIVCQKPSVAGLTHPYCRTAYGADGLISLFDYHDENVKKIIISGKYSFVTEFYRILGRMMAEKIKSNYADLLLSSPFCLTPVPLSSFRQRWRGFNQAEILCQTISAEAELPIADVLKRHKLTKVQKDVKKKEDRAKNMSGAFALREAPADRGGAFSPIKGRCHPKGGREVAATGDVIDKTPFNVHASNFLLVDDVVTTGSTLLEAVKVLKRNGANKVFCLTVARD